MRFSRQPPGGLSHAGRKLRRVSAVATIAAFLVAGCATSVPQQPSGSVTTPAQRAMSIEDQVKERAVQRWQALIKGDLESAYGYFSRATRDTYPIELYRAKMKPGGWREAKVDSVKCADSVCEVTVIVTMDHSRLKGIITPVPERWIVQDGIAWYVYNG
jgi:hypothetical protein